MPNEIPSSVTAPAAAPQSSATDGMFSAAQLQAPLDNIPQSPAPRVASPEDLAQAVPDTAPRVASPQDPAQATPEQPHIFEAMTPTEMVTEAKANPKAFDPIALFQSLPADKQLANMDKAAETFHQLRQSGHYTPSLMDMLHNAGKSVADIAKEGANLASRGVAMPLNLPVTAYNSLANTPLDDSTFLGALNKQEQQQAGEFLAGQKVAALGLGQMFSKGASWLARGLHLSKGLQDYTPEDKMDALTAELATRHGMADAVKNGISADAADNLAKQGYGLRPEKVEQAASGSPYAWEAAGKTFGGGMRLLSESAAPLLATIAGDTTPAGLATAQAAVHSLPAAASDLSARAVGRTIQGIARAGEFTAEKVEPLVKPLAQVGGGVGGAFAAHGVAGPWSIPIGIAEGVSKGGELGEKLAAGVGKTAVRMDKLAEMGKQIATGEGMSSSTGQLVRDLAQAAPGAAAHVGAGMAMDVGLGAATTETPGERAGFTPFGTILGGAGAARGMAGRALSGHIIAPRAWGSDGVPQRPETFASNFPALNAEHTDSIATAPQGVQQRFNAVQKFLDGAAPGTQLVYAPRPEAGKADTLPQSLSESGINPDFATQDGFFTKATGADGNSHPLVVVRSMEAAPHEARHAMDDVIGASATENLNATAKQEYAGNWDSFKQQYADRLTATGLPTSDPDGTILRETGYGNGAAKEKIIAQTRDALDQEGQNPTDAQVKEAAGNAIQAAQGQAQAAGQELWQTTLTPEEQAHTVDQYVGGEVRAEHHDAWFKAGQPGTLRGKMGMAGASVLQALGVNPLEGRTADYSKAPLESSLVQQAAKSAPKVDMAAEAPAAEGSPAAQQQAVRNAQKAQAEASNQPVPGANKSQKEVLGIIAEAIARKQGVKLTGLFAPDEPAASLTSDRETRRAMIETYRTMPDAAKKLWGKLFYPENVPVTGRGGNLQIFGWAPEVFAANAHKVAGAMNALADKGVNLSPYELDPVTKTFTEQGWRDLYDDTQKFVQNQMAGRTGSGNPLVVPESVARAGASAPPLRGETQPLAQDRADFISSLFHAKLPDTGLARQGALNMPLNKAGQLVSAATMPGRVEAPVEPRGTFRGAVAVRQGVKGEPVMEVNPFRNQFEAALKQAGIEKPSLIEANQRLNLKNIKDVELAPEQGQFRANTLTLQAGFQPAPKEGTNPFIDSMDNTSPREWLALVKAHSGVFGKGQMALSMEVGANVKSFREVTELKSAAARYGDLMRAAIEAKDLNAAAMFSSKAQAAREAYETATGTGGIPEFISRHSPNVKYTPPFPDGDIDASRVNFQPGGDPRAIRAASVRDEETGKVYEGRWHPEAMAHALADKAGIKPDEDGNYPERLNLEAVNSHPNITEGFSTNSGEFLNRDEAFKRAVELKQYTARPHDEGSLESTSFRKQQLLRAQGYAPEVAFQPPKEDSSRANEEGNPSFRSAANSPDSKLVVDNIDDSSHNKGSFMAKRKTNTADEKWELKPGGSQFTKAWILPSGELAQFGGTWHHDWLNDQPKLRKQYNIPEVADASEADKSRVPAMRAGFSRINYDKYSGKLTVEARDDNWSNVLPSVQGMVKNNPGKFDSLQVHLFDKGVKKVTDSKLVNFLDIPRDEQVQNIPFSDTAGEGNISTAQVGSAGTEGGDQLFQKAAGDAFGKGTTPKFNAHVRDVAKFYAGEGYVPHSGYDALPEARSKQLADAYADAQHEPSNPAVQKSYAALKRETVAQYDALKRAGYTIEPWTKKGQPYANSAEMSADVRNNKHIYYFPSEAGFGENAAPTDHPLMENSDVKIGGKPVPFNDLFRAVHDVFGHAKEGYEFGPRGEYNAYLSHSAMYSDAAKPALTAETLGQNSWVNFGAHLRDANGNIPKKGEPGFVAPQDRPFAEQKATTMQAQPAKLIAEEDEPERITRAAVRWPNGEITSGRDHAEAADNANLAKFPNQGQEGFVTSGGNFVSRHDAVRIADRAGQLDWAGPNQILQMRRIGLDSNDIAIPAKFQPKLPAPKPDEFAHEDTIETALAKPNWAIFTGTQEAQGAHDSPENVANNTRLYNELAKNGHTPIEVKGSYQGVDQGRNFLVTGISPQEALDWGKRFKQDSVLTPHGLLYSDGSIQPPDATQTKIGPAAEKEPYFSRVENGPAFSLGFDKKVKPAADEMVLGDLGTKKPLSTKQVAEMTKAQLAAHYPESVIPRAKDDEISSDIVGSPLAKEAGNRPAAIDAFANKLVDFAKEQEKTPGYQAGLKWYSEFVPKLKKVYGKHAQIMAELLAATSPNNAPDTNFAFANDALEGYVSGRFDKQIAKFNEGLSKIEDGSWEPWLNRELKAGKVKNPPANPSEATFLDHWITKHNLNPRQSNGQLYSMHSVPVLRVFARKWLENTSGPKTQNFVKNLLGTGNEATIDVWADRTMRRLGYADHQARWRILPKNGTGVSDADFAFSQEAFRKAADALGIQGDALQGGLWFAEKQLWSDRGWGRLDLGDYRKEIAKVDMLKSGITQRLNAQKAKAKAVQMEQPELVSAR